VPDSGIRLGLRGSLFLFLLLGLIATGLVACDPGHRVTYENRTNARITVFRDQIEVVALEPSQKREFSTLEFVGTRAFEARDENGRVIYSEALTWMDLKARDWKIIIAEAAQPGRSPAATKTPTASPSPQ
jgi:hypothetical protein